MKERASTIPEDRPLTAVERDFIVWILTNGDARAQSFLPQMGKARVVGRCRCGCGSIDLAVNGITHYGKEGFGKTFGMEVLNEYQWGTNGKGLFGAYVFACNGLIAGLDLWQIDGVGAPPQIPSVSELRPYS